MARKQEQERARSEVSEVARDVLRMELPVRIPGLGHVNCYALLDDEGCALVDPGLPGPGTWAAIEDRLRRAGLAVRHVHTVVITHSHPDHFGGASRLAKEAGARIVAHDQFFFGIPSPEDESTTTWRSIRRPRTTTTSRRRRRGPPPRRPRRAPSAGAVRPGAAGAPDRPSCGASPGARSAGSRASPSRRRSPTTSPTCRCCASRSGSTSSCTPRGHTEDHICLHCPEDEVFLSGDHVLPTITPHISGIARSLDPLRTFYESLDLVAATPHVKQVLPAHGHPFASLAERCRAIQEHHDERLAKARAIGRELGPATVEAFTQRLFRQRSWGPMAESETYAHLEHLRIAGKASCHRDRAGMLVYEI